MIKMHLSDTQKQIINHLKIKPLDDIELAQLLNKTPEGIRARLTELRKKGYQIKRKYTFAEVKI